MVPDSGEADGTPDPRRAVPRTDAVLADPRVRAAAEEVGARQARRAVAEVLQRVREGGLDPAAAAEAAAAAVTGTARLPRPVLNATGVIVHTNLGRAPLSAAATDALVRAAGYVDVEFDLDTGSRARRGRGLVAALRAAVPAAGDAFAVNNGAAALVLATTALAAGREVVVSRGEMVEIGDGFRLPDLVASTGARLREVGTTNRVTLADYEAAIGPDTAAVLKVHPSNFVVRGFTSAVPVAGLATLPVPVIADVGSGLLDADPLLPDEPDVTSALRAGAAVVTCSGDKLLGGPQAGLLFGEPGLVGRLRRHPLARALRIDKLAIAALTATLEAGIPPVRRYLEADADSLRRRCDDLAAALAGIASGLAVVPVTGAVGGGGAPEVGLPGWAVTVPAELIPLLRRGDPPVVGRIEHGRGLLDLRCVPPEDDARLAGAVRAAVAAGGVATPKPPATA